MGTKLVAHHGDVDRQTPPEQGEEPTSAEVVTPPSASYSLAGSRQAGVTSEDRSITPGPGRYNSTDLSVYLTRRPSFSMQSRTTRASDQSQKPGPGTHSPKKVLLHLPRTPAFSLGITHLEFLTPLVVVVSD
ncbi:outer dense fiber protein 3-like [Salvelinus fontinalis]|uniref:outer dense fiber protein 3-like n=1 Tax=Salvelinus fontinalis TaxID=8038 RepID=UPI0024865DF0|nr:outer dense fiber protein 3-like [Salvelinus fontinalis]